MNNYLFLHIKPQLKQFEETR